MLNTSTRPQQFAIAGICMTSLLFVFVSCAPSEIEAVARSREIEDINYNQSAQRLEPKADFDIHSNLSQWTEYQHFVRGDQLYWFAELDDGIDLLRTDLKNWHTTRSNFASRPDSPFFRERMFPSDDHVGWQRGQLFHTYNLESGEFDSITIGEHVYNYVIHYADQVLIWKNIDKDEGLFIYDFDLDQKTSVGDGGKGFWPRVCSESWVAYLKSSDSNDGSIAPYIPADIFLYHVDSETTQMVGQMISSPTSSLSPSYECTKTKIKWYENGNEKSLTFSQLDADYSHEKQEPLDTPYQVQIHERADGVTEFLVSKSDD